MSSLDFNSPRAPLSTGKSGTIDIPDRYQQRLSDFCDALDSEAEQEQKSHPEWDRIGEYINLIEGKQWESGRAQYRSRFVDNHIARIRKDARAQYIDIRPAIEVTSSSKEHRDKATMLSKAILGEWSRHRFDLELIDVIDHGMFGDGFWKIGALEGSADVPSRLCLTPCGIDTVIPIKCTGKIQDSAAVVYKCYKLISYFKQLFGDRANGLEREAAMLRAPYQTFSAKPDGMGDYTWSSMAPAMRRWIGRGSPAKQPVVDSPYPMVQLREYWVEDDTRNESGEDVIVKNPYLPLESHNYWYRVKPGMRLFPRKRLVVRAGNRVMYDGPGPYWHSFFPFENLKLDPNVWSPGGLSKYRNLVSPQKLVNRIGGGLEDTIIRALNQTVIGKRGTISEPDWQRFFPDMPGQKLWMTQQGNPSADIRYMDGPQLPSYVLQTLQTYLLPAIEKMAGTLDVNALARKKQIPSMDSIESMKEVQGGHFRLEGGLIEAFLAKTGTQCVSNILQFFTVNDRMRLYGADGITSEDFDWEPQSMVPAYVQKDTFWRMFQFQIAPHSLHGSSEDRDKQVAIALRRQHDISRRELFRRLKIQNAEQIERELAEEAQQAPQPHAASGRTPRLTQGSKKGQAV